MAGDRHQLAVGKAVLGADCLQRLAEPMRGHAREARLVAAIPEPVTEARHCEGLAELRHEKREVPARAVVEDVLQCRQDREHHADRLTAGVLRLREAEHASGEVLAPQPDDVGPTLPGVEQQREGEAGLGSDRVTSFESADLVRRPGREAV